MTFGFQGNYPAGCDFRGTPYADGGEVAVPDEVFVCLDGADIAPGLSFSTGEVCAVYWTHTGRLYGFERNRRPVEMPPALHALVNDWLSTADGQRAVQEAITRAMEDE